MSGEGPLVVYNDEARLAEALRRCGVEVGSVGGDHFRRVVASRLLESDWLARYVARRESEAAEKARASSDPIIRYADLGNGPEFDEFIAHNATVHVEAMGRTSWWIGVDLPDGRTWHINLGAMNERAKFYARCDDVTCYPRADSVAQGREEEP
jgi:hypothetical protein